MKHKDAQEVKRIIAEAMRFFAGDIAEYINYFSERLSTCEDKLGISVEGYAGSLEKYYKEKPKRRGPN